DDHVNETGDVQIHLGSKRICTSPVSFTWSSLYEFMTRQLVIGRVYAPGYWISALLITFASQLGFWAGLIGGAALLANGNSIGYWLLGFATLLYATSIARGAIRQSMGRLASLRWRTARRARRFDVFAGPLTGLFLTFIFARSAFGRRIVWRNVGYHIGPTGRIQLLGRRITQSIWSREEGTSQEVVANKDSGLPTVRNKSA
ncbi:MAG: hypothetical protein AAF456_21195, partial [Planctomycetota bacterium]